MSKLYIICSDFYLEIFKSFGKIDPFKQLYIYKIVMNDLESIKNYILQEYPENQGETVTWSKRAI